MVRKSCIIQIKQAPSGKRVRKIYAIQIMHIIQITPRTSCLDLTDHTNQEQSAAKYLDHQTEMYLICPTCETLTLYTYVRCRRQGLSAGEIVWY